MKSSLFLFQRGDAFQNLRVADVGLDPSGQRSGGGRCSFGGARVERFLSLGQQLLHRSTAVRRDLPGVEKPTKSTTRKLKIAIQAKTFGQKIIDLVSDLIECSFLEKATSSPSEN